MKIGDTFVHGIYAGVDASQNYDNNGNWAETTGRLMHFSGKDGAVQIAEKNISNLEKEFGSNGSQKILDFFDSEGINTQEEIDEFNNIYNATEQAKKGIYDADIAMQEWAKHKKESEESSTPQSFSEAWAALDTTDDENLKTTKKDLLDLAEAGQLSADSLSSVQGAEDYFKKIGLSAQEAANKINDLVNSSQQLSSMQSGIKSITDALSTKEADGIVSAMKTYIGLVHLHVNR